LKREVNLVDEELLKLIEDGIRMFEGPRPSGLKFPETLEALHKWRDKILVEKEG